MNEVEKIIRDTIRLHSYYLSDSCIHVLADRIDAHYADVVEKAWQYDELSD